MGADELDIVEIIMKLEDEFQTEIPDEMFMDKNAKSPTQILNTKMLTELIEDIMNKRK